MNNYTVYLRFYEELNDFLPVEKQKRQFSISFKDKRNVKDLIESIGVPHVEIDLIMVNGKSVDFNYIVKDNDYISVYPVFESIDISPIIKLRNKPLRDIKFICDVHLHKLAKYLRLLGFDCFYDKTLDDCDLAKISYNDDRVLLTRDIQLLKRKIINKGYMVRNTNPLNQIVEVILRLDLKNLINPFTRCMECNNLIGKYDFIELKQSQHYNKVPEGVLRWCKEFFICYGCKRVYWKGSHYDKLKSKIDYIIKTVEMENNKR